MLTHRALLANVEQVAEIEPAMVTDDDVVYGVLPLFHVYGLNAVLGQVVRQAATIVLVDAFEEPQGGDLDARVVDDQLETPAEVEALVADYLPRATRYAGPLS